MTLTLTLELTEEQAGFIKSFRSSGLRDHSLGEPHGDVALVLATAAPPGWMLTDLGKQARAKLLGGILEDS